MLRKIIAVIAGYLIFAVSSVLLFQLSGQHPHEAASLNFKLITIAYGVFFSILAGLVLQIIARENKLTLNFILALLMFTLAGISALTSKGDHWTQLFAMFIFAPVSVLGGYLKIRFSNRA